ncbi:MAG: FeoA family protein [Sandaracinobacteroides sp.]
MSLTLDTLPLGSTARVSGFGPVARDVADRLIELGFDEGAEVEALHRAPLGDPIAVRVDGTMIALRRALARAVLVSAPPISPHPVSAPPVAA